MQRQVTGRVRRRAQHAPAPLQVMVRFRHVAPTAALRRYAEQKLARLARYLQRSAEAHVVLTVTKHRHTAEVTLVTAGGRMVGEAETGDLYSAVDLAVAKIQRQVAEKKARRRHHKGAVSAAVVPTIEPQRPPPLPVPRRRVAVRRMSLEDATAELERGGEDALVFRDEQTGGVSVVYRRRGGELEVLETGGRR